jgi:hypothetical protein
MLIAVAFKNKLKIYEFRGSVCRVSEKSGVV